MLTSVVSSTILSSVVVRKIVIIVVSMEMGGEVVGMTVGDRNIDEIVTISMVLDCTIPVLSPNPLAEELVIAEELATAEELMIAEELVIAEEVVTARSLPVIAILDIELVPLLIGVGTPSTVVVEKMLKL